MPRTLGAGQINHEKGYAMKYAETTYLMKKRMAGALREALMQKSFSKITVSDIVDTCGVNRKTFYYHFSDIHALLQWMFREEIRALFQPQDVFRGYAALANNVMDYVEQNEILFRNVTNTVGEEGLKLALYEDIQEVNSHVVGHFEQRYGARFEEGFRCFLIKLLTDAIVGILTDWIRNKKFRNREDIIKYLHDIYIVTIPGLIEHRIHLEK